MSAVANGIPRHGRPHASSLALLGVLVPSESFSSPCEACHQCQGRPFPQSCQWYNGDTLNTFKPEGFVRPNGITPLFALLLPEGHDGFANEAKSKRTSWGMGAKGAPSSIWAQVAQTDSVMSKNNRLRVVVTRVYDVGTPEHRAGPEPRESLHPRPSLLPRQPRDGCRNTGFGSMQDMPTGGAPLYGDR